MGYTTDFEGRFRLNRKLDEETHDFLSRFADSRRMKRNLVGFGVDGELFVPEDVSDMGQRHTDDIVDYNKPPSTQPGLWCSWCPSEDGLGIEWNGMEKFYRYVEWIEYIIVKILAPRDYVLNGAVTWQGEDEDDVGVIAINNNVVTTAEGIEAPAMVNLLDSGEPEDTEGMKILESGD
jgi:hypothetical protein